MKTKLKKYFLPLILLLIVLVITIVTIVVINKLDKINIDNKNNEFEFLVFIEKNTKEEEINKLEKNIQKIANVTNIEFKSKEEWKQEMIDNSDNFAEVFKGLDENPLLDSFTIYIKDICKLDKVVNEIKELDNIENINYGKETIDELIANKCKE